MYFWEAGVTALDFPSLSKNFVIVFVNISFTPQFTLSPVAPDLEG